MNIVALLHQAVSKGDLEQVKEYLSYPEITPQIKNQMFLRSCGNSSLLVIEYFLSLGFTVDQGEYGAIREALKSGYLEVLTALLSKVKDFDRLNKNPFIRHTLNFCPKEATDLLINTLNQKKFECFIESGYIHPKITIPEHLNLILSSEENSISKTWAIVTTGKPFCAFEEMMTFFDDLKAKNFTCIEAAKEKFKLKNSNFQDESVEAIFDALVTIWKN